MQDGLGSADDFLKTYIHPLLCNGNFRFIKLKSKGKEAIEKGWQKDRNYIFNDPNLLNHIIGGGNYGVLTVDTSGICILDSDDWSRLEQLEALSLFSDTLTIKTGSDEDRYHFYFKVPELADYVRDGLISASLSESSIKDLIKKKIPFFDPVDSKRHLGEVYMSGCPAYVVGPGSLHPSGNKYVVVNNSPIRSVSIKELDELFFSRVKSSRKSVKADVQLASKIPEDFHKSVIKYEIVDEIGLKIEDIGYPAGEVIQRGDQIQGTHPIHGSTTGSNFAINPSKNVWYCFRCGVGGNPIQWLAVRLGLVSCSDAPTVDLKGNAFLLIRDWLKDNGYRKQIEQYDRNRKGNGRGGYSDDDPIKVIKGEDLKRIRIGEDSLRYECNLGRDSFIQQYAETMSKSTDAYVEYQYAAAMGIVSVLCFRHAVCRMQQSDIYPNLWIFLLGSSTISRKTTVIKHATDFLLDFDASNQMPASFSPEGLIEELCDNPRAWFFKDEVGSLLTSMQKTYMADARDLFCDLYECRDYRRRLRRSRSKNTNDTVIHQPYITQLVATTPDNFRQYTTMIDMTSGWLLRYLYICPRYPKKSMPWKPQDEGTKKAQSALKQTIDRIFQIFRAGRTIEFRLKPDALDFFQQWQMDNEDMLQEEGDRIEQAMYGRLVTYAVKLAMIFKISSKEFLAEMALKDYKPSEDEKADIDKKYIVEACRQIDEYFMPMSVYMAREVARNEETNIQNKILGVITRAGGKCPRTDVMRALHVKVTDLNDAISALIESGEVQEIDVYNQKTQRKTRYFALRTELQNLSLEDGCVVI